MGYDGWNDFVKDYIEEIQYRKAHANDIDYNFPFQEQDTLPEIMDKILELKEIKKFNCDVKMSIIS